MKILIIGGGQTACRLAAQLSAGGHQVTVIEQDEVVCTALRLRLPGVVVMEGSGSDPMVLERAGVSSADAVVAVTGQDEVNLVASTLAKIEFAVPRVLARVNDPDDSWLFTSHMGVDVAVDQAELLVGFAIEHLDLGAARSH